MLFDYAKKTCRRLRMAASGDQVRFAAGTDDRRGLIRMVMEVIITIIVLPSSLYFLASPDTASGPKEIFAGFAGSVIGYWMRPNG